MHYLKINLTQRLTDEIYVQTGEWQRTQMFKFSPETTEERRVYADLLRGAYPFVKQDSDGVYRPVKVWNPTDEVGSYTRKLLEERGALHAEFHLDQLIEMEDDNTAFIDVLSQCQAWYEWKKGQVAEVEAIIATECRAQLEAMRSAVDGHVAQLEALLTNNPAMAVRPVEPFLGWRRPITDADAAWVKMADGKTADGAYYELISNMKAQLSGINSRAQASVDAEKAARKAAFHAEMVAWVEAHGSERLKLNVANGYDAKRLYAEERAALDLPKWAQVDFDDKAAWDRRSGASLEALRFAAGVSGEVVWLTTNTDGSRCAREAVVIRGWLGRYDVVWTGFDR